MVAQRAAATGRQRTLTHGLSVAEIRLLAKSCGLDLEDDRADQIRPLIQRLLALAERLQTPDLTPGLSLPPVPWPA